MKPKKKYEPYYFSVGPWTFEADNFEDWKPGYQLSVDSAIHGVAGAYKTFKTPQNLEKWVRIQCLNLAKRLMKELKDE